MVGARRIAIALELILGLGERRRRAAPLDRRTRDRLGRQRARDEHRRLRSLPDGVFDHRVERETVPVDLRIARYLRQLVFVERRRAGAQELASRPADALHRHHIGFEPAGEVRQVSADLRAAEIDRNRCALAGPFPRQRADGMRRNTGDPLGPGGGLGRAVVFAHDMAFELVEAERVACDVLLVVAVLDDPGVGQRQIKCRVGVRPDRNPGVGMDRRGMIEVGRQRDDLDAGALEPLRHFERDRAGHAEAGCLRIVAGENDHLGVFEHVVPDRVLVGLAERGVEAPDVLRPPVVALPTVWVPDLLGPPAPTEVLLDHVEQVMAPEMQRLQVAALAVSVGLDQDRLHRAVLFPDAVQLADDDVERLIPADPRVAAAAAHVGIGLLRAPAVAQQWIFDPGRGVYAPLCRDRQRHLDLLPRPREHAARGLDLVEPDVVGDIERQRPHDLGPGHVAGHGEVGTRQAARRMGDIDHAVIVTIGHGTIPPACARRCRVRSGRSRGLAVNDENPAKDRPRPAPGPWERTDG